LSGLLQQAFVLAQADPSFGKVDLNSTQCFESFSNTSSNLVKTLESDARVADTAGQLLTTGALVLFLVF
jgi:hypothetical protein